jgi:N-acetylmuramoyl-L-alanine amidase
MATSRSRGRFAGRAPALSSSCFALIIGALGVTGCQAKKPVAMVENLPQPNFDGPPLAKLTPPEARPVPVKREPVAAPMPPTIAAAQTPKVTRPAWSAGVPREWVPQAAANKWNWIVIHHSATSVGGAGRFDKMHRTVQHWDELGYHFVIGNGSDTKDGLIEVGSRWPKQKWGAHAKTPDNQFNERGIGICLVGNFDEARPTEAQLRSLAKLVAHLQKTYRIPSDKIIGHSDTGKPTECPGRNLQITRVRRMSSQVLAHGDIVEPTRTAAAAASELLVNQPTR